MGLVLDQAFPTFPAGFPDDGHARVRAPHRAPHARQRRGLGDADHRGARARAHAGRARRSSTRRPTACSRSPRTKTSSRCRSSTGCARSPTSSSSRAWGSAASSPGPSSARPARSAAPPTATTTPSLPAADTLLDLLTAAGVPVLAIGKIKDLFAGRGISRVDPHRIGREGMDAVERAVARGACGLVFANLVDFDAKYGHRNDAAGYAANLERFDERLGRLLPMLGDDDLLILTADHGNDPTTPSTDHSREYVPVLACGAARAAGVDLGDRETFADLGQTIAEIFGVGPLACGPQLPAASGSVSMDHATIREELEQRERETLAPQAARSVETRGRLRPEPEDDIRPAFQRDRDRIIHCKAFRRLKHKTQVFFAPTGDHYRTRLTHTLEVSQIARTIARALALNEELTEAIALGHDLGHTPFGHQGERVLADAHARRVRALRAEPAHRRRARARRRGAQPDLGSARRHRQALEGQARVAHRRRRPGEGLDARRADRPRRRPHRLRQSRHRRRGPGGRAPGSRPAGRPAGRPRRDALGPHRADGQGRRAGNAGRPGCATSP